MELNRLGFLAIENGGCQEAVNIFRKALSKGRQAESYMGLGVASFRLEDFSTARWAFSMCLEIEPGNRPAAEFLGKIREKSGRKPDAGRRGSYFRAGDDCLEIFRDGAWRKFFVKGINLGLGLPGYFPGEFPVQKGTYLKWFGQISNLGINSVRIYTVHPPCFYEALAEFNREGTRLWLVQGIWAELPDDGDFRGAAYMEYVKDGICQAVDAVFGSADIPVKPGCAHGRYRSDVSAFTAAFVFGREWEPRAVSRFNTLRQGQRAGHDGEFIRLDGGSPFAVWIAEMCDILQGYEHGRYDISHPVSVINWPTLDPLSHPSESDQEGGLLVQGKKMRPGGEDMVSLDTSGIRAVKGRGFFSTYHVYPYYPDFMNNEYPDAENPYLSYLCAIKNHHGRQPVLIAEFGVPSSREITHWQKNGWYHGGHDEKRQGEIDGLMMETIRDAGMAGGVLFSWFDEWFKRNWLCLPYELPADRKPLWFNLQDAEENYGLLGVYPGYPSKKVSLSCREGEWDRASVLYEKRAGSSIAFKFNDGHDDGRAFRRLLVQHDEGFLYIRMEMKGEIDFSQCHLMLGLDTCDPESGEFLLPGRTNAVSPTGLKFVVHLAGRENSRILVCRGYDKYLNGDRGEIVPGLSREGAWVSMYNRTNNRRLSRDGKTFFPARVFPVSNLRFGSLDCKSVAHDSLADFFCRANSVELRIPWGLLNFTDPSSGTILWLDKSGSTRISDGIRVIAVSYKPEHGRISAAATGAGQNITDSLPERLLAEEVRKYAWDSWEVPVFHTYLKAGCDQYRKILKGIPDEM